MKPSFTPGITGPSQQRVHDLLEDAGTAAITVAEIADKLVLAEPSVRQALTKLERAGLVAQFIGRGAHRVAQRWALVKYAPAAKAAQAYVGEVAAARTGPLDDPWRSGAAPARVVSAGECRPWASAAAACIGGAR